MKGTKEELLESKREKYKKREKKRKKNKRESLVGLVCLSRVYRRISPPRGKLRKKDPKNGSSSSFALHPDRSQYS